MKFKAICENHLFSKAYSKGKRCVTSALAVYVLPDYAAKRIAKSDPKKEIANRIGLTTSVKLGALEKDRPLKKGFLIVIAARSAAVKLKSSDIKGELEFAFTKLDLFKV